MQRESSNERPALHSPRVWLGFAFLLALFVLLGWPTIRDLSDLYLADSDYSHGFLIVPVALYLCYLRKQRLHNNDEGSNALPGLILTSVGATIVVFGQWYDAVFLPMTALFLSVSGLGLIICLLGIVRTVFGCSNARLVVFPIAYLVFALPLPGPMMAQLTLSLQSLSSYLAAGSLQVVGTQVLREGNILHLSSGTIGVAAACSGIRSLWCLLAVAVALGEIKKLRPLKAVVLVAAVPFLGVAGNLIRLFITGLLVANGRQDLASGQYHEALGMLTILLPGAAIFGLGELLAARRRPSGSGEAGGETSPGVRDEGCGSGDDVMNAARAGLLIPKQPHEQKSGERDVAAISGAPGACRSQILATVIVGCVLVMGTGVAGVVRLHYLKLYRSMAQQEAVSLTQRKQLSEFPNSISGFTQFAVHDLSTAEINALAMSDYVKRMYAKPGEPEIGMTLMFWNPRQVDMPRWPVLFPHVADACYPGSGWTRVARYDEDVSEPWLQDAVLSIRLFTRGDRERVVVYWHSETHGLATPGVLPRLQTMFTAWNNPPSTHLRSQYSVKVEVDVAGGDVEIARQAAVDFARSMAPLLWEYGIGGKIVELGEGRAAYP